MKKKTEQASLPAEVGASWPLIEVLKDDFWVAGKRRKVGDRGRFLCAHDVDHFAKAGAVKVVEQ